MVSLHSNSIDQSVHPLDRQWVLSHHPPTQWLPPEKWLLMIFWLRPGDSEDFRLWFYWFFVSLGSSSHSTFYSMSSSQPCHSTTVPSLPRGTLGIWAKRTFSSSTSPKNQMGPSAPVRCTLSHSLTWSSTDPRRPSMGLMCRAVTRVGNMTCQPSPPPPLLGYDLVFSGIKVLEILSVQLLGAYCLDLK